MTVDSKTPATDARDAWTVARIIDWTTQYLKQHGSDTPRLDAEILLAHTRKCRRIQLYTHFAEIVSEQERATMRDLVRRRAQAEPVAYLVGHREFYGLDFQVSPAVLIPRPDTETLVLELIEAAKRHPRPKILDVCTGSGCVAIAVAVGVSEAELTAIDISRDALEIARKNAETHSVDGRIRFLEGDLFAPLEATETFDFVVGNPPYVATEQLATLDGDVRRHEPHLALDGGPCGMSLVSRVIREALPFLRPGGSLMLEIGDDQADLTQGVFHGCPDYEDVRFVKDVPGRHRVVLARKASPDGSGSRAGPMFCEQPEADR